jgi:hypothetical protein
VLPKINEKKNTSLQFLARLKEDSLKKLPF